MPNIMSQWKVKKILQLANNIPWAERVDFLLQVKIASTTLVKAMFMPRYKGCVLVKKSQGVKRLLRKDAHIAGIGEPGWIRLWFWYWIREINYKPWHQEIQKQSLPRFPSEVRGSPLPQDPWDEWPRGAHVPLPALFEPWKPVAALLLAPYRTTFGLNPSEERC